MADSFCSTGSGLVDVVAGVLAEHGPTTEERLVSALRDRGVALGDDPHAESFDDDPFTILTCRGRDREDLSPPRWRYWSHWRCSRRRWSSDGGCTHW